MIKKLTCAVAACLLATSAPLHGWATDVEVLHWWTSPGEAAAVKEIADLFESTTGHKWIDGAIAGAGAVARPVMTSRILGGDPMAAMQFNHGLQAQEMIEAGLLLDVTDVVEAQGWKDRISINWLLDSCTYEGKVYCAPLNLHGEQWLYTSLTAFDKVGIEPVTNWQELKAAAPKLREAGIIPLAVASAAIWRSYVFYSLMDEIGGADLYLGSLGGDEALLKGEQMTRVFDELVIARELSAGTNVEQWNMATNMLIKGEAAVQIMGDWALGDFNAAGSVQGKDYDCFVGLGPNASMFGGGDAFYFPLNRDGEIEAAQKQLAATLLSAETQLAFNLKKGSMPVVRDVDVTGAGTCMQRGLEVLNTKGVLKTADALLAPDAVGEVGDLMVQFFGSDMTAADAQARFADIILATK